MTHGVEQLTPLIRRVVAPNPGPMTGGGTNSFIVGHDELALIDPGPAIVEHIDRLVEACGDRLRWVMVTHTHADHSPAAAEVAARTGAELVGRVLDPDDGHQDTTFRPASSLQGDEVFSTPEFSLRAVHTPGHVANHMCFFLEEERTVFAGDHVMGGSTVVIIPPAGDMAKYIESLRTLRALDPQTIMPGHGDAITDPERVIDTLIRHRLHREQKVISALQRLGESSLDTLLPVVYDDVRQELHRIARYSLWAHLLKLEHERRAVRTVKSHWAFGEEQWRLMQ